MQGKKTYRRLFVQKEKKKSAITSREGVGERMELLRKKMLKFGILSFREKW